ncbi:hypothetical protein GCM10011273_18840 [Asticcacaulis endophyticus]|uniref:HTH araC/xylS-type domain-containing protein n=2 Tax=Asticcacaulis endophyticus TaxID=1395890 RepID=A0A918USZ2_9CAUL|nr:hypothetical protein GCM10011273_18840 [Asticcacaulis endophyticus]
MNLTHLEASKFGESVSLSVIHLECDSSWEVKCQSLGSDIIMTLPLQGRIAYTFADGVEETRPGQVMIYPYGDMLRLRCIAEDGVYRTISLRISRNKVQRVITRRTGRFNQAKFDIRRLVRDGSHSLSVVGRLMAMITEPVFAANLRTVSEDARYAMINTVAQVMVDVIHSEERYGDDKADAIPLYVTKALTFIQKNLKTRTSVHEVASHCAVSVRKLERGFRDNLGVSPTEYSKNVRLEHIRMILKRGASGRSISTIAAEFGFSNRTRFLRDYLTKFGEAPKDTRTSEGGT